MSSSKIPVHQHRKKKYVYQDRSAPFPVPIASITREKENENHWYHYTGEIVGNQVLVHHSGDISYLSDMGFFGRGLMSRGAPTLYDDLPYVHIPTSNNEDVDVVNVMRRHMYLRHMKWRKSLDKINNKSDNDSALPEDSASDMDEEFDSDVDFFGSENHDCTQQPYNNLNEPFESCHENLDETEERNLGDQIKSEEIKSANEKTDYNSWESFSANQKTAIDSWQEASANERSAIESWNTAEADEDFWASEDLPPKNKDISLERKKVDDVLPHLIGRDKVSSEGSHSPPNKKVRLDETADNSELINKNCDSIPGRKLPGAEDETCSVRTLKGKLPNVVDNGASDNCVPMDINDDQNQSEQTNIECRTKFSTSAVSEIKSSDNDVETSEETGYKSDSHLPAVKLNENEIKDKFEVTTKGDDEPVNKLTTCGENSSGTEKSSLTLQSGDSSQTLQNEESSPTLQNEKSSLTLQSGDYSQTLQNEESSPTLQNGEYSLPVHPYCNHDDVTDTDNVPDYLVIDDSDIDDNTVHVPLRHKTKWLPVRKKEIFQFNEPLMLSFEEAFFLCYGLGCLTVTDETQEKLTIHKLWGRFNHTTFLPRYIAYHYFRSKGWVPKPNILFGTDLLVYKVGPAFYHASYSVIIRTVYEDTYDEVPGYSHKKMSWSELSGLNRVTEHVAKTLVYCYVIFPRDLSKEELMSPQCISRFKVRLQYVHRWISSQEREQNKNTTTK
ncbi:tRNA-splicing endonuclease subunit Sen2 [Mactra antiquata]